jgi:hypothetical protein
MRIGRRQALVGAGAMLLVPFGAHAKSDVFAPPAGAMLFTRSLRREMIDGAAMGATRTFAIRFVALADGFAVEGEQSGAAIVEAPPSLETFAKLERERRETGLFPLKLDRTGLIVEYPADTAQSPQLDRAVEEALHRIAASNRSDDEQMAMRVFVLGLQQAAAALVAAPPADLFRPSSVPLGEHRTVALPDGGTGEVSLTFTARLDPVTGLMREAERVVLTRLAGTERRTRERWTLTPA